MSEQEIACSDIYLKDSVVFESPNVYVIKACSGRGKSSLLNFIYGLNYKYDGKIYFDNKIGTKQVFNHYFSYLFQDLKLFNDLSVWENICLKNDLTNFKVKGEIERMLQKLDLFEKRDLLVGNLSFGQQQRVAIIRTLCQPFQFLFLDEPFSHIDHETSLKCVELISSEVTKQNAGLIITTLDSCSLWNSNHTLDL
ncbi:ATP-binding cassette domain-containing protein [Halosquirtibacter laminarini]|uniref:ATP-binding cassette domain-containing protein n=1 Tax=Halosquirtibacter laminarini TaxID=3374600 RepID=A0AC61NDH6_9BACT|nr:ATP-binding cassette domain-containing protein [Prolixibacteraceae bacterium]